MAYRIRVYCSTVDDQGNESLPRLVDGMTHEEWFAGKAVKRDAILSWGAPYMATGLPFTDAELERFQETLRQGKLRVGSNGGLTSNSRYQPFAPIPYQDWCTNCGSAKATHDAQGNCHPLAVKPTPFIPKDIYFQPVDEGIPSGEWSLEIVGGEAILRPIEVSLCTAKPSCGFPDEECPVCKAGNCPGVKCWRCGR